MLYEVYSDTECPRCANQEGNRDAGPYEYMPGIDDALGGVPDPRVHLMWCGACGKSFDAAPEEMARAYWDACRPDYPDYCPTCPAASGVATIPFEVDDELGTIVSRHECPAGHRWSALWGRKIGQPPHSRVAS